MTFEEWARSRLADPIDQGYNASEAFRAGQASGFAQGIEAAAKLVRAQPIHSDFPLDMEIALLLAKKIDALKPPEAK